MDASGTQMTSQAATPLADEDSGLRFFLQPATAEQRRYEALRAVIVEGLPQKEVAQHFGYTYDSLRQLLHEFRVACRSGEPPPFSFQRSGVVLPASGRCRRSQLNRTSQRSPMRAS